MTERMDVLATREYEANGEKKTAYTRIGVAFATSNGGWSIKLECTPVPQVNRNGLMEVSFVMFPPKECEQQQQSSGGYGADKAPVSGNRGTAPSFDNNTDDDIPFTPERRV